MLFRSCRLPFIDGRPTSVCFKGRLAASAKVVPDADFRMSNDGESPVRAFQVLRGDHSATLVRVQRFTGKLGGRQGTFVLQGHEIVENSKIRATWVVVPGSGTGDLSGLRGEGGFEGQFGKGSTGTLDYWFE